MENYPRDELFQVDDDTLYRFALEILNLSERPRIRVLARPDEFDRFVSVLVFIPKDRYDSQIRRRVGEFLASIYGGRMSAAYPAYPSGPLARTHYVIGRDGGETPKIDRDTLERGVIAIVRTWGDALQDQLADTIGGRRARSLAARYANAFSAAYREAFAADEAIRDVDGPGAAPPRVPRRPLRREGDPTRVNLKVFSRGAACRSRNACRSWRISASGSSTSGPTRSRRRAARKPTASGCTTWRSSGPAAVPSTSTPSPAPSKRRFWRCSAGLRIRRLQPLVLEAGLGWRDAAMVRALGRYLRQVRITYAQDYLAETLARHGSLAALVVKLFYARFDPREDDEKSRAAAESAIRAEIEDRSGT